MFRKYYAINGGMFFDVINWSGSTKIVCVHDDVARSTAARQDTPILGCENHPKNGQLFCRGQPFIEDIVPLDEACELKCFDGFTTQETTKKCVYSPLRLPVPSQTMWSTPIECTQT